MTSTGDSTRAHACARRTWARLGAERTWPWAAAVGHDHEASAGGAVVWDEAVAWCTSVCSFVALFFYGLESVLQSLVLFECQRCWLKGRL